MNKLATSVLGLSLLGCAINSQAHTDWQAGRSDSHAPIGVMGDHTHNAGEFMLSYRYMAMQMKGLRDGTDSLDNSGTMVSPTKHDMNMHMLGLMYAPSDRITLMGMINYLDNEMTLDRTMMGNTSSFKTQSSGLGDLTLGALINVWQAESQNHRVHLNTNLSIPTGDIKQTDDTPMGSDMTLGYAMQTGSGTWDVQLGATYLGQSDNWSWGVQGLSTIRTGENSEGYTLGDKLELTTWLAKPLTPWVSVSARIKASDIDAIDGSHEGISAMMVAMNPAMNADNQGGQQIDALIGVNLLAAEGALQGHRLGLEMGLPAYRDLNGPQLEQDASLTLGWQKAF